MWIYILLIYISILTSAPHCPEYYSLSLNLPTLVLKKKTTVLILLDVLHFYVTIRIPLSISIRMAGGIFIGIALNFQLNLGKASL